MGCYSENVLKLLSKTCNLIWCSLCISEAAGLIRHLLTVNPAKRATISEICSHWWVNLGHSLMPDNEPYVPPMVLQPVPSFHNQTLSSSSESDDGEPDITSKPKIVKPLKGILKKPKMAEEHTRAADYKRCNEVLPCPDSNEKENPQTMSMKEEDSVFKETVSSQPNSPCDNSSQSEISSDNLASIGASQTLINSESAKKVPFDSQVKPKRSILKRKGKFSNGDSGCDLNDSNRKDSISVSVRPMDLSEADSALDSPDGANKFCPPVITQSYSSEPGAFAFSTSESLPIKNTVNTDSLTVGTVPRRRGILKNANRDPDKRLSACSIGSNSSADILDFSYDSSDELLTNKFCPVQSKIPTDFKIDVAVSGCNSAISDDLFNYKEASEVCKKALEICQNF